MLVFWRENIIHILAPPDSPWATWCASQHLPFLSLFAGRHKLVLYHWSKYHSIKFKFITSFVLSCVRSLTLSCRVLPLPRLVRLVLRVFSHLVFAVSLPLPLSWPLPLPLLSLPLSLSLLVSITYCLLPIAFCLLPIAYSHSIFYLSARYDVCSVNLWVKGVYFGAGMCLSCSLAICLPSGFTMDQFPEQ